MNTEDREWQTEKEPIVPTFVVVNISTSRRGLELITEALIRYYDWIGDMENLHRVERQQRQELHLHEDAATLLADIETVLDGLKG